MSRKRLIGFTLAELLICIAILGEIATFTIPKILTAQQNQKANAITKEDVGILSQALQIARLNGTLSASTKLTDLTPYMNYVKTDNSSTFDDFYTPGTTSSCATHLCVHQHNGTVLMLDWPAFGGTGSTNALFFSVDPNGKYDGTVNGPGNSVGFFLFYNGRVATVSEAGATCNSNNCANFSSVITPPWFSW
jgi:prepilin-type N-terminal cleavage/methylation domain-containing protein